MSTRGQSRPLALEQCDYERGHTQIKKKPLKSRQQGRSAPTSKNLTSTAPSMFRNNVTARLTGFTRFHTCTAPNPESDKLTKAKPHKCGSSNHHRCRHGNHSKRRQIDEDKSHKYGSSNHYYRWTHSNIQSQRGAWTLEKPGRNANTKKYVH